MPEQQKKISVIIPIYNAEKYLSRCLASVTGCGYENLEIICVNDGSPDGSKEIIRKFGKKDSRIKTVEKENGGLSSARNAGLALATGEYISFVDADDWIHPDYFDILIKSVSPDTDAVICGFRQTGEYSAEFAEYGEEEITAETLELDTDTLFREKRLEMFRVYSCGVLYRKEKLRGLFPEGIKVIEDNIFNLLNLPLYSRIKIINLPLYFYFVNPESIMHTYGCGDAFSGLVWLCGWLDENRDICEKQKRLIIEFIYKRSFYYRYVFDSLGYADRVRDYLSAVYESMERHDRCLSWTEKRVFRFFRKAPGCYRLIKLLRGDGISRDAVFSTAPNKLLTH